MDYRVEIEDMQNLGDPLIVHYASRDSINHSWVGSEDKVKPIIPCEFSFDLEDSTASDGRYIQYFTQDEKRYRVTEYLNQTNEIIYRGYLLPETYEEPYENAILYVRFQAIDGLGLLKGKKLPLSYYKDFKSPIQIICECLKLTEIDFDIYFSPALENTIVKNWDQIYLETLPYYDEEKLPSAFQFLEDVITSLKCQLFQCQGKWFVEGVNKRQLKTVDFQVYDINGSTKGVVQLDKNIKDLTFFYGDGIVGMVPALGGVTVSSDIGGLALDPSIFRYSEKNWIIQNGITAFIYPTGWVYKNAYVPKMQHPDYYLRLPVSGQVSLDYEKVIELREKPYIFKDTRIRFKIEFQFVATVDEYSIEDAYNDNKFVNTVVYQLYIGNSKIFSNEYSNNDAVENIRFDREGSGELNLEFFAPVAGYFNIKLFAPKGDFNAFENAAVEIRNIEIEDLAAKERNKVVLDIAGKSTNTLEVDLPIGTDNSQQTKCFTLDNTKEEDQDNGVRIAIPIKYGVRQNDKSYSIVDLAGAKLINDFPKNVFWRDYWFEVKAPIVHFNFNNSEEFAVETNTPNPYTEDNFYVTFYPYKVPSNQRENYFKWTDSVYKIEEKPYNQVIAEIYKKLFSEPHLKITGSAGIPIKFNDILRFRYKGEDKFLVPTDISRMPDAGIVSRIIAVEAFYTGSLNATKPLIDAGSDIYITQSGVSVQIIDAIAKAAYGEIRELQWEQIDGPVNPLPSIQDANELMPLIRYLEGDFYTFKLTGTDSFGNSASDTMNVVRVIEFLLKTEKILDKDTAVGNISTKREHSYRIYFEPGIPNGEQLILSFNALINIDRTDNRFAAGDITIKKNGNQIYALRGKTTGYLENEGNPIQGNGVVSIRTNDEIVLEFLNAVDSPAKSGYVIIDQEVEFTKAEFPVTPKNRINNLPQRRTMNQISN